jgi:metallo-beta-lactamase class B
MSRLTVIGVLSAIGLAAAVGGASVIGQSRTDSAEAHVAEARVAAGPEHTGIFNRLCTAPPAPVPAPRSPAAQPPAAPDRSTWHAEPVKVFDNLYFLGEIEYSAWALTTSNGIILIDAIYDYSVEDEVVNGMKKLGLDRPASRTSSSVMVIAIMWAARDCCRIVSRRAW